MNSGAGNECTLHAASYDVVKDITPQGADNSSVMTLLGLAQGGHPFSWHFYTMHASEAILHNL